MFFIFKNTCYFIPIGKCMQFSNSWQKYIEKKKYKPICVLWETMPSLVPISVAIRPSSISASACGSRKGIAERGSNKFLWSIFTGPMQNSFRTWKMGMSLLGWLTTAKLDAVSHMWLATLSAFNFSIWWNLGFQRGPAEFCLAGWRRWIQPPVLEMDQTSNEDAARRSVI